MCVYRHVEHPWNQDCTIYAQKHEDEEVCCATADYYSSGTAAAGKESKAAALFTKRSGQS